MPKLERLTQNEEGEIFGKDVIHQNIGFMQLGEVNHPLRPCGRIRTIVFKNPVDIEKDIEEWAKNYPASIPAFANSYVVSEFNESTQRVHRDDDTGKESLYSVYAVQFYYWCDLEV